MTVELNARAGEAILATFMRGVVLAELQQETILTIAQDETTREQRRELAQLAHSGYRAWQRELEDLLGVIGGPGALADLPPANTGMYL